MTTPLNPAYASYVPAPWTQTVQFRWRPELSFLEKRAEFLRALEVEDRLPDFQWRSSWLVVRLGKFEMLEIGVTGASVQLHSPKPGTERLEHALGLALTMFSPRSVVLADLAIQYLLPARGAPEDVQRRTGQVLLYELEDTSALDWAVLVDGHSDRIDADFTVEYGVVAENEVEDRLSRVAGRVAVGRDGFQVDYDAVNVPSCALFLDWNWTLSRSVAQSGEAIDVWRSARDESERLSLEVQKRHGLADTGTEDAEVGR